MTQTKKENPKDAKMELVGLRDAGFLTGWVNMPENQSPNEGMLATNVMAM